MKSLDNYILDSTLSSYGVNIYKHICGFEIIHFKNSDKNRVFSLCVKTVGENDRGIPHVLEHMILAGSNKYRIRDPFNELEKSSLYTYLNAITYRDKTIYPVASKSALDFKKMVEVYLDGIFSPLLEADVFAEEGLGIVLNEMQAIYDEAETQIDELVYKELFKNTYMAFDTGGNPKDILKLELEEIKDYYNKYYQPQNMLCYFYGNVDIEYYLEFIHSEYLKKFLSNEFRTNFTLDCDLNKNIVIRKEIYGDVGFYYSIHFAVFGKRDFYSISMISIMLDYLLGQHTSPLSDFFTEKYNFDNVKCDFNSDAYIPVISIKMRSDEKRDICCIYDDMVLFLEDLINKIDEEQIVNAYNNYLFDIKEEDYGYKPKGLGYCLEILESWLYTDDRDKLNLYKNFTCENIIDSIKFYILNQMVKNEFVAKGSFVCVKKNENLSVEKENLNKEKVNYQSIKLPLTNRNELYLEKFEEPKRIKYKTGEILVYPTENKEITYINLIYKLKNIKYNILGLFLSLLGNTSIKNQELYTLEKNISKYINDYSISYDLLNDFSDIIIIEVKAFTKYAYKALELIIEMIKNSDFSDVKHIKKQIREIINDKKDEIICDNSEIVINKALSYVIEEYKKKDAVLGFDYFRFLQNITDDDISLLDKVNNYINFEDFTIGIKTDLEFFCAENFDKMFEKSTKKDICLHNNLFVSKERCYNEDSVEFLKWPVSLYTNVLIMKFFDDIYCGEALVLGNIIKNEILNKEIRLKNGAYGFDFAVSYRRYFYFISTEDKENEKTYLVFNNIIKYLDEIILDDNLVHKNIIGTINSLNFYKNQYEIFHNNFLLSVNNINRNKILEIEKEIIGLDAKKIKKYYKNIFSKKVEKSFLSFGNKIIRTIN